LTARMALMRTGKNKVRCASIILLDGKEFVE